jgi:hypothetical protein
LCRWTNSSTDKGRDNNNKKSCKDTCEAEKCGSNQGKLKPEKRKADNGNVKPNNKSCPTVSRNSEKGSSTAKTAKKKSARNGF